MRVCVHAACNTLSAIGHDRFRDGFARLGALIFLTVSRPCFPRGLNQLIPGSQVFTICSSAFKCARNIVRLDSYKQDGINEEWKRGKGTIECTREISIRGMNTASVYPNDFPNVFSPRFEVEIRPTSVFWSSGWLALDLGRSIMGLCTGSLNLGRSLSEFQGYIPALFPLLELRLTNG